MLRRDERCGVREPGRAGPCRYPAMACPKEGHQALRRTAARDAAIAERDLRALGWWLIDGVLAAGLEPQRASVTVRIMSLLERLGPGTHDGDDALREVVLRGLVMAGIPPRTPDEWAIAERVFDDEALAEIRRWALSFEGDGHDAFEPLVPGQDG